MKQSEVVKPQNLMPSNINEAAVCGDPKTKLLPLSEGKCTDTLIARTKMCLA